MNRDVHRVRLHEAETEFEIQQFAFAYLQASGPYNANARFGETNVIRSEPILRCGPHLFCIVVCWTLDSKLMVDYSSVLGVGIEFMGDGPGTAVSLELSLLNQDPIKTVTKECRCRVTQDQRVVGWCMPPFRQNNRSTYFYGKLNDVLQPPSGFMHEGSLIVKAKLVAASEGLIEPVALQNLPALGRQLQAFFNGGRHANVQLRVEGEIINVHSIILSAWSPVFEAMWEHNMAERNLQAVLIEDLKPRAVKAMVKFMYSGTVDADVADANVMLELLLAAHKYQITALLEICSRSLSVNLTNAQALERLMLADLLGIELLRSNCLEFLTANADRLRALRDLPEFPALARNPGLMGDLFGAAFPPPAQRPRFNV